MDAVRHRRVVTGLVALGTLLAAVLVWIVAFGASDASAQQNNKNTVYGLTANNRLVSFGPFMPGNFRTNVPITGLGQGEKLVGMDFRPINRKLYAVSDESRIYTIRPNTGAATRVGGVMEVELEGTAFGVDFNPMADALRIVSNTGQNLRVPMADGATGRRVVMEDDDLSYSDSTDAEPRVTGAAYSNNVPNATETVLYDIDFGEDTLVTQTPANDGTLQTVGELGVNTGGTAVGFDIAPRFGALAALKVGNQKSNLYSVNLVTGEVTSRGALQANLLDIAIQLTQRPETPPEESTMINQG